MIACYYKLGKVMAKTKINQKKIEHYPGAIDNHPIIAKEGWIIIIISIVLIIIVSSSFLSFLLFLWVIFCFQFFRDPKRKPSGDVWSVLAPADGKVIAIEKTNDPIRNVEALKVSIFMNVFNVHSNRSPINGKVISRNYFQGSFINADFDKASLQNERNAIVIKHAASKHEITCMQIAGLVARRILCYVNPEDEVLRGQRYGYIRFGSRVDLYLPIKTILSIGIGENVSAAIDVIGKLPQK